jgi:hypothetical protein
MQDSNTKVIVIITAIIISLICCACACFFIFMSLLTVAARQKADAARDAVNSRTTKGNGSSIIVGETGKLDGMTFKVTEFDTDATAPNPYVGISAGNKLVKLDYELSSTSSLSDYKITKNLIFFANNPIASNKLAYNSKFSTVTNTYVLGENMQKGSIYYEVPTGADSFSAVLAGKSTSAQDQLVIDL